MEPRDDGLSRRLNGLLEKRKFEEERRKLISESLRNGSSANKKIVFKDSDDDDYEPQSKKLTLFEKDDEDPQLNKQNPADLLKNRFTGYKSEKLTEMETRFNYDERFKVDERFLEGSVDEIDKETGEMTSLAEKKSQFAILSSVLGHEVSSLLTSKKKVKNNVVRPFQRFDPDNPNHVEWMETQKQHVKVQNKPLIDAEQFNREVDKEVTKVVEGHFYEMDQDFAKELHKNLNEKKSGEAFSFLSLIGRSSNEEEKPDVSIFDKLLHAEKTEETPKIEKITPLNDNVNASDIIEKPFFFIYPFDEGSKKVLNTFRRQQDMAKVKQAWQTHRDKTEVFYKSLVKTNWRLKEKEKKQHLRNKHAKSSQKVAGKGDS
ncbi:unnamed protein product [Bursaphelenchus xylophilus]|uniref:(pine wood nematode) hypothetical protein n=1 Tax=Bursaphelenchus xylophilus TaxID=6326 RepID=A0A1I7SUD1_BURXY|nr:unnamed protein product [Bursaphelenchus xylophilus]CAG9107275.1 unnamed protein product [Bursaphelenchus xylophilus]